jgi:hypothetical protein
MSLISLAFKGFSCLIISRSSKKLGSKPTVTA